MIISSRCPAIAEEAASHNASAVKYFIIDLPRI
jgi:hypothetical protein